MSLRREPGESQVQDQPRLQSGFKVSLDHRVDSRPALQNRFSASLGNRVCSRPVWTASNTQDPYLFVSVPRDLSHSALPKTDDQDFTFNKYEKKLKTFKSKLFRQLVWSESKLFTPTDRRMNTWSPPGVLLVVVEPLRGGTLLDEVGH